MPPADHSSTGSPLICLHGWLGGPADFDPLFAALRANGWPEDRHPLLALPLPGHDGQPLPPSASAFGEGVTAVGRAIEHVLAAARPRAFRLLGYSMGGRVALAMAAGLGPLRPAHTTILGAHPGLAGARERADRRVHDDRLAAELETLTDQRAFEDFARRWYGQPLFRSLVESAGIEECVARRTRQSPLGPAGALRLFSTGSQPNLGGQKLVAVRALAGEHDQKYVAVLSALAARCEGVTYDTIPAAGHAAHLEAPEAVARVLLADLRHQPAESRNPGPL